MMVKMLVEVPVMDFLLIRHGEAEQSTPGWYSQEKRAMDPPLTSCGLRQALALAPRLASLCPSVIVSSDLRRAVQTADAQLAAFECPRIIDPAFREIDMGEVWTRGWDAFPEIHQAWRRHEEEDLPYPGGENGTDVWNRCRPALEALALYETGPIAVVAHGGTIRSIVCGLLRLPQTRRFQLGGPLENTSLTWVRINSAGDRAVLHIFNDFSHVCEVDERQAPPFGYNEISPSEDPLQKNEDSGG